MNSKLKVKVQNITCASCISHIEKSFNQANSGIKAYPIFFSKSIIFEFDDTKWNKDSIAEKLVKIGYPIAV